MRYRRFLVVIAAAMLLVAYSGCGSDEKKESASIVPGGHIPKMKSEKAADGSSGDRIAAADNGAIDLSLLRRDDIAAIVIRPRQIAQSPLVAEQLKDETIAGAIKKFGIDPSEVEQIVVISRMGEMYPGHPQLVPTVITHFTHDVDAKEVLAKLQAAESGPGRPNPIEEVMVGGKTCLDTGGAFMTYAASKNTIIMAPRQIMGTVVSATEPNGPLFERLKKADADNHIIVAVETGDFPNQNIEAAKKGASPLVMNYLDAIKTLRGGTATFNLTAPSMLRVVLDAKSAEMAGNAEELLQQTLRMAGGSLLVAKQAMPKDDRAKFGPLLKLADESVNGAKTTKSGSQVTLNVIRPEILDTASESIIGAVRQYVMESRAAGQRLQQLKNTMHIGIAMIMYEQANRSFPPAVIEKDGRPLLSWRVAILPFLEADALYRQFHLDEPWDSPHNLEVAKTMPSYFQSPDSPSDGKTRVMLFTGKGAAFDGGKKVCTADIRDGTSNTILCVEAGPDKAVPWTKPEDLAFDPENPLAALGKVSPQGIVAAFFDGSMHLLKVDNKTLKALITPDGGEPVNPAKVSVRL